METLKRILTVMVVTLVLIIVVGGLYTFGMGNMNHDKNGQVNMTTAQNQTQEGSNQNKSAGNNGTEPGTDQIPQDSPKEFEGIKNSNQQQQPDNQQQSNAQTPNPAGTPVIIQPVQTEPKIDPRLYVEQLKEQIREINEANSQIASNAGETMVMQSNGSSVSSGQSNMNELHQGFYKLGQNVSSIEQTLDKLAKTVQESNAGTPYYGMPPAVQYPGQPQTNYYPYGNPQNSTPNYYQHNPYNQYFPYGNNPMPNAQGQFTQQEQNQSGQQQMPSGQSSDLMGSMNSNMQMNQNVPMNHFSLSGLLNVNTINMVFSLILIVSIILGIIAVIGFISSLFKPRKASQEGAQIQ